MAVEVSSTRRRLVDPLYLPLVVGLIAAAVVWVGVITIARLPGFYPSFFVACLAGVGVALGLFASEQLSPARSKFELPGTPEHPELRAWLYYWIVVILLVFGAASSGMILLLGVAVGGPLVVGVGVPMTTIYFLLLLSRYSTRSFSHDVRQPLRSLSDHIVKMDTQSVELNRLVGQLQESTTRLATAVGQLVELEKKAPGREKQELESIFPHLWIRAFGTPPAWVSIEIENRGLPGVIESIVLDFGYGPQPVAGGPWKISAGVPLRFQAGQMAKKAKALQLKVECTVQGSILGRKMVQRAAFDCEQLKSGWGTPQGVKVQPAEAQDGMRSE